MKPGNVIEVEQLSKRYRLGGVASRQYATLRDRLARLWSRSRPVSSDDDPRELWALHDVGFEVREGEALGIIGSNGAGKSTLLKILSRITEPTAGRARVRGRVASLLEVGTGFHPELTGRENVYLNGAILGMSRTEIRAQFDSIVAFAEVERFLDTPVKHYSSGMYVRLAFAVAAHLTPEILIVDEVLAVGDLEFQRRCLGRMRSVARSGRTVLFVSHNLAAVEELCSRSLLLRCGRLEQIGPSAEAVAAYLSTPAPAAAWDVAEETDREGTGRARISRLELLTADGQQALEAVPFLGAFRLRLHYEARQRIEDPTFGWGVLTERGERVVLLSSDEAGCFIPVVEGSGFCDCLIERPNLLPGTYALEAWISEVRHTTFADHLRRVGRLDIVPRASDAPNLSALTYHDRGRIFLTGSWSHTTLGARA